ncbi:cell envelope integrity protein TolA [Vibrio sp. S4M6]|uniref:cell envelope integrity protein TolA n=1 Tax=Vibrio sinus TaxID=2946865 RepID=UPI00202A4EB3|nr:cell envelope integrity protein TolA [Vibrio sinus]MCL9782121.1 cell envelope integrity protein TolA [Vibrio sinus]
MSIVSSLSSNNSMNWFEFKSFRYAGVMLLSVVALSGCAHTSSKESKAEPEKSSVSQLDKSVVPQPAAASSTKGLDTTAKKPVVKKNTNTVPQQVLTVANTIQKRVESNLYVPKKAIGVLSTEINFHIDRETNLVSVKIVKSSGNFEFDNRVKIAVFNSFPLPGVTSLNDTQYHYLQDINLTVRPEK